MRAWAWAIVLFVTLATACGSSTTTANKPPPPPGEGEPTTRAAAAGSCGPGWNTLTQGSELTCCTDITPDGLYCAGLSCSVSGTSSQFPSCSGVFCPSGSKYYGAGVGGFCCGGTQTGGNLGSCSASICALDPARPQGNPTCPAPKICAPGWNFYGASAGGFCCEGQTDGNQCDGRACAIDPSRGQGRPPCSFTFCAEGSTYYGGGVGGFCCAGNQTGGNMGSCSGSNCALDVNQRQGASMCFVSGGQGWSKIKGTLTQVSVGSASQVMGASAGVYIFRWTGSRWVQFPGRMASVSIGSDGTIWGLDTGRQIWRWSGSAWDRIGGSLVQVSVGAANQVWGVNDQSNIYRWNGGGWDQIAGQLKQVAVGQDGTVWGVKADRTILRWTGTSWEVIPGALDQVSVGNAGNIWGVNDQNSIYRWRTGGGWDLIAGKLKQVAVGPDGAAWGLGLDNTLYLRGPVPPGAADTGTDVDFGAAPTTTPAPVYRQVMCGKTIVDEALCGIAQIQCGWENVTDAVKCGYDVVKSGVQGCAYDTVVRNVTDAVECGKHVITDGATCGWSTFTDVIKCLGTAEFYRTGKCTFANSCSVANTCPKTFYVAKECQVAKTCPQPKLCNQAKVCQVSTPCGTPVTAVEIFRHAEPGGTATCRAPGAIDSAAGCCGSPGSRGCIVNSAASLLTDNTLSGACTGPAGNELRLDPYSTFPICDLPPPSCGPGIAQALASTSDTFYVTSDLHFFRESFVPEDQVAHVKVMNDWITSAPGWKGFFGLPTTGGDTVIAPRAVVVNGDFTLGGSAQELSSYRMLYEMGRHYESIRYPVFVGLGNHEENYNVAGASAAKRMFDYVTDDMRCPGISMDVNVVAGTAADITGGLKDRRTGSGNYSWDFGNVHHVQLNNWAASNSSLYVHDADGLTWLAQDLATKVGTSGRPVILHQHFDNTETAWHGHKGSTTCSNRDTCLGLLTGVIKDYNVVAWFFGHAHTPDVTYNTVTSSTGRAWRLDGFRSSLGGGIPDGGTHVTGDFIVVRTSGAYLDVGHVEWVRQPDGSITIGPLTGAYYGDPNANSCRKRITDRFTKVSNITATVTGSGTTRTLTLELPADQPTFDQPLAIRVVSLPNAMGLTNRTYVDSCSRSGPAPSAYLVLTDDQLSLVNQHQVVPITLTFAADPATFLTAPATQLEVGKLVPISGP